MSGPRDELEVLQAQARQLAQSGTGDEPLALLASTLEHEADAWEQLLIKAERRAELRAETGQGLRLITTGFTLLAVMPIVVMISSSVARALRYERELAVASMLLGGAMIAVTLSQRWSRALARLVSRRWRLLRRVRRMAAACRAALAESAQRQS